MSEPSTTLASLYMLMILAGAGPAAQAGPAATLVDPTRPHGWRAPEVARDAQGEPQAAAMNLQGTFHTAGRRSAVINGRRVAVGDRISGAEVIEISKDRVVVEVDGERMELVRTLPTIKAPVDIRKTADNRPAAQIPRLPK